MANIFLTRKCNLKCSYCFADEFVNKDNEEFTIENFIKAKNFIKTLEGERLGLIGGEPTLHSKFSEILDIIINDNDIKSCIIFTNGLEIHKFIDKIKNKKFSLLLNCNSPLDIGITKYNLLKDNIKLLNNNKDKDLNYSLGINLYSDKLDYSFIFDLLKITNQHILRFSTALPNSDKEETIDALGKFRKFKPFLFNFFEDCLKNEIILHNDCNAIPICLMDSNDKKIQLKLNILSQKYNTSDTISSIHTCSPVIDILPDMTAVRCFGLSKYLRVPISDFKNIDNLRRYFFNKIDLYARLTFENKECENCNMRLYEKCGLCYTYKLKRIEKIKETLKNID